ncbi:MAG: carboxypeptidase M32 [Solirubrobacteraceae bacterium]
MTELRERLETLVDLGHAAAVLEWDQGVMMPHDGGPQRAQARATLAGIRHRHLIDAQTARLLERAEAEVAGLPADGDEVRLVRKVRHRYEKARRVPAELPGELAAAASEGHQAWVAARAEDDFSAFAPHLQRNLDLTRRYVDCFEGFDTPYDVLLDDYDPGTTTAEVTRLFAELKDRLMPLIARLRDVEVATGALDVEYPVPGQRQLVREVVERMGFRDYGWRLDDTVHPFATSFGSGDVRITTRYQCDHFPTALYGAMHECGHGLYEAGIDDGLQRTPLARVDSLAVHESQSRMWENFVGRSRAFSRLITPRLVELSGGALDGLGSDSLFRAVNAVTPSLIRIEADETTYGLHVVMRFEVEQDLIDGKLKVSELPEAWNARLHEYLGVEVGRDADGVLQDVHWSEGLIGYFPTYALGNLIAGQLWAKLATELPELDVQIEAGEFAPLREWLRSNVHRHGSKFSSRELLERVVGRPIEVQPFVSYLEAKLSDVYQA